MNPPDAMELLVNRLEKTKTNAEFLMSMNMKQ
jgi:transcription termination factor Rho